MNTSMNASNISADVNYNNNNSIVFSAIIATAVFVFQIMNITSVVSVCFYISIALVAANYVLKIVATKKISVHMLIISVLMLFSFAVPGFVFNFEVYKRAIIVLCCIICIEDTRTTKISLKEFRIIEFSFIFAVVFANYMFYIRGYNSILFQATNSIAMNFSNPNALALWLTAFFIALSICLFIEPHKFLKIAVLLSALSLLPIISATESRNSLFSCIFVIGVLVITMIRAQKRNVKSLPKWIILLLTALPAIIFFVYMFIILPNIDFFNNLFSFLIRRGKSLGSRATVWKIVYDDLGPCFLFGKYNKYYNGQMHNSLMTLYCMFGAPVTFLISSVFYKSISHQKIYTQIALLGIWLTGCFEASIFVGIAGIYLMLQILPAISSAIANKPIQSNQ